MPTDLAVREPAPEGSVRPMRVAVFSHSHPSLSKGGAEIAAHALFKGLRDIGVDAIFVAACEQSMRDRLELGPDEHAVYYSGQHYDHFYHLSPLEVREQLVAVLARERVTVLSAHHFLHVGVGAFDAVRAAGIEVVLTLHEFLAMCHNHGQMITRQTRFLCERPSPSACRACYPEHSRQQFAVRERNFHDRFAGIAAFVSPSHFLADRMTGWGLDARRMHVVENGVVRRDAAAQAGDRARKLWTFGFFGQINPFKGMDTILAACEVLARDEAFALSIRIAIHGNFVGQSEEFIARFERALLDYPFLTYSGPYDNRLVGALMGACDYVLVPSNWWENSPVVIQEAYHARRPVICTGIGGMAEKVVNGVTGLHFARNDPYDLAARLQEAADPALHADLVGNLPQAPTPVDMARAYRAIFEQAAGGGTVEPASEGTASGGDEQ